MRSFVKLNFSLSHCHSMLPRSLTNSTSAFKLLSHNFLLTDVPSAPTGLRVSNVTDKSADVSWTAPDSDGGTPITNYIVQTRIIPRSTFTTVQETTETKVTLTGLVADSQYMLQIIAVNAEGQSLPLQSREPICPEKILSKCLKSLFS